MKLLLNIVVLGLLAGCAATDRVELGNQTYSDLPARVYLVPMEGIPPAYVTSLAQHIEFRHKLRTKATTVLGKQPSMFDAEHRQYIANEIAKQADQVIKKPSAPIEQPFVIILTPYDINAQEFNLRFLFAAHFQGVSVISTARIDPVNYGLPRNDQLRDARLMKLIDKAIGQQVHRYSISSDRRSVMYGPIMSVDDLDAIGAWY